MNKKVLKKVIAIILLSVVIISIYYSISLATYSTINIDYITDGAHDNTGAAESMNNIVGAILTVVQVIGMGISVIMLIVLAIKYMVSSPSDRADVKKSALIYVVGAVILFSISAILGIIRKFSKNIH